MTKQKYKTMAKQQYKVVTLSLMVKAEDTEWMANSMASSDLANQGYVSLGVQTRDATADEIKEAMEQDCLAQG
jgi:hypothetical protein